MSVRGGVLVKESEIEFENDDTAKSTKSSTRETNPFADDYDDIDLENVVGTSCMANANAIVFLTSTLDGG